MHQLHRLVFGAALAAAGSVSFAAAEPTTQIYQQRTADGRILLTDRPSPVATTERSWQMKAEDPAASRQRALDVKAEAQAVTERVQRSIDSQRYAMVEEMRINSARAAMQRTPSLDDNGALYGGGVVGSPYSSYGGYGSAGQHKRDARPMQGGYGGYGGYSGYSGYGGYANPRTTGYGRYIDGVYVGGARGAGVRAPAGRGSR